MRQGATRGLAHVPVGSTATDEAFISYDAYRAHAELHRERLLERIDELEEWLDKARTSVKADVESRTDGRTLESSRRERWRIGVTRARDKLPWKRDSANDGD